MVEKTRVLIPTIGNSNCARRAILYKKMILTFILWLSACTLFAQQISRIEDLQPLVKEEWRLQLDLQPTLSGEYRYAVLKNGVVTFSEDMQTLSCVGFEGRKLWEKPGIPARTSPIASPNGEYIHTYRLTGEEKGVSAIWAKDGDMLWQREGPFYNISPSSRFLVTYYSRLNPRPLEILDIRTGQTLWELEHASYWQAAVSENDRIVYYEDDNSLLKFFELLTGELLWEKTIGTKGNDYGHLVIASFGRAIVFQDKNNTKMERFTYVLNSDGRLIWEMTKLRQPGKTNGGIVRAISDDGRFIAMSDLQEFALYAVDKINPIWIIKERMRPQYVQKYAGKVLAFRPHPNNSTRVFLLNENGTIKQDYHFLQRLEFKTPWPHKVQVIEPSQDRLDLSLIDLPINSGN